MTASDERWNAKINSMDKIKNLRRPVVVEINGATVTLVTIGHMARALRRTTMRLKQWEECGVFPPAPYRLVKGQQRLYPIALFDH